MITMKIRSKHNPDNEKQSLIHNEKVKAIRS